jgi:FkbM family methyltransferase
VGIGITSYENLLNLRENAIDKSRHDLEFIYAMGPKHYETLFILLKQSQSQLRQDLFVLVESQFKREGYFVEFGATNGIDLSNSYLLEQNFMWKGILAEPARVWHPNLERNRPNSKIETLCVWSESNSTLLFNEAATSELSTVALFSHKDRHTTTRKLGKKYQVQSISLLDMLKKHDAPNYIDYLSIDTEGSEYEILNAFDFNEYSFGVISVEHNYTPQREKLYKLLTSNGYKRKFESLSLFDDWYTK